MVQSPRELATRAGNREVEFDAMRTRTTLSIVVSLALGGISFSQNPTPPANPTNLGSDASGNPLRKALKTGHVSNYDEAKVSPYTLPDPFIRANGEWVRDAGAWTKQRRPELIRLYETEIYARVPSNAPKVTWEVGEVDRAWRNGTAIRKQLIAHARVGTNERRFTVWLYTPAKAT